MMMLDWLMDKGVKCQGEGSGKRQVETLVSQSRLRAEYQRDLALSKNQH